MILLKSFIALFRRQLQYFLLLLLLVPLLCQPLNASTLTVDPAADRQSISEHFEYLKDPQHFSRQPSAHDVIRQLPDSHWTASEHHNINLGYGIEGYWFRVRLNNPGPHSVQRLVEVGRPFMDIVDAYIFRDEKLIAHHQLGDARPLSRRPIVHNEFIFPLDLPANSDTQLLIYVFSGGTVLQVPTTLLKAQPYAFGYQKKLAFDLFYVGAISALLIYNFFIFISIRELAYFYYILYAGGTMYTLFSVAGYGAVYLWPETPQVNAQLLSLMYAVSHAAVYLFCVSFLNLKTHLPRWRYFLLALAAGEILLYLIGVISTATSDLPLRLVLYHILSKVSLIGAPICLITGIYLVSKGLRQARYFTLAWSIFTAGQLIYLAAIYKLIDYQPIYFLAFQLGQLAEVLLLAFALADRLNSARKQQQQAAEDSRELYDTRIQLIEARVDAQSEQAANKAKSEFLATMSHEIRTPMTGVLGMAELLRDTTLNEQQQRFVNTIADSGKALLAIINDILDFSKISAGKMTIENIDFNLEALLDGCLEVFSLQCVENKLLLVTCLAPDTPLMINGDPTRLRQVLLNLLGNARKFTEAGEITVKVEPRHRADGETELLFSVRDTGIGLTKEQQQKLFQSFSQADRSTTRRYGGTGLGLSISKRLVNMMGGEIYCDSALGKGSCFSFSLPHSPAAEGFSDDEPHYNLDLRGQRMLIVDQHATFAEFTQLSALSWGMMTQVQGSGENALKELVAGCERQQPYDLVLLDYVLPGIDGLSTAEQIRSLMAIKPKPAVILCGTLGVHTDSKIQQQANRVLHGPVLEKPIGNGLLRGALITALGGKQLTVGSDSAETDNDFSRLRVLVVDDNKVNLMVIKAQLARIGIDADTACDGLDALQMAAVNKAPYDLIFMDFDMPNMDGYTATRQLRLSEQDSDQPRVLIIGLSANTGEDAERAARDCGMDDYLSKPVQGIDLEDKIATYFGVTTD